MAVEKRANPEYDNVMFVGTGIIEEWI